MNSENKVTWKTSIISIAYWLIRVWVGNYELHEVQNILLTLPLLELLPKYLFFQLSGGVMF